MSFRRVKLGSWVIGVSNKYQVHVKGFITKVDMQFNEAVVQVTECPDNPSIIGIETVIQASRASILPVDQLLNTPEQNRSQYLAMIDCALAGGDKAWFDELSEKIKCIPASS